MSTDTSVTPGRPGGGHIAQPGNQLAGRLRHRPGRGHPGHRHHRPSPSRPWGRRPSRPSAVRDHRPGRVPVHGGAGRPVAAPHRRDAVLRLRELQAAGARRRPRHIGGVSGWSYWLGWFPVAPINMILAASYIAVLFHVPLGGRWWPLGGLGTPEGIGVLVITLVGLVVLFIPCYLGIRLGAAFRHRPRASSPWCRSPCSSSCRCSSPAASTGPTSPASTSPIRRRPGGLLPGLDLRHLVERHRRGGGRLLRRRVPRPAPGRQDRPHRRGPLRGVRLRRHRHRVRRRAGGVAQDRRPADPLHQLRRPHLRQRGPGSST